MIQETLTTTLLSSLTAKLVPEGNQFNIKEAWRSDSRTSSGRGMPVVADVDNDGKPEVISYNENKHIDYSQWY